VWEKIEEKLRAVGAKSKGLKKKLVAWAKSKGLEHQLNCQLGGTGEFPSGYSKASILLDKVQLLFKRAHTRHHI
jgi:hypothetical protein